MEGSPAAIGVSAPSSCHMVHTASRTPSALQARMAASVVEKATRKLGASPFHTQPPPANTTLSDSCLCICKYAL